ncbi:cupin domain-containing protein [Streptomyces albofaciens JCM 4342]|uniref:cupin domain-containing protein n=1 Tax=Streptomyces albofaciens TaxID=66866 RepID=UPI00123BDE92|nr:cupin domain-containing protein [Streptomyces albofaciens]KAA6223215.1 cupin domain-containing protein [Streptomyces albofaciens JCM 4342]
MHVVTETDARTTRTAAAAMFGLAAPSQGSTELCTWRVEMAAGKETPVHTIDREQVWMPISGAFEVVIGDETEIVKAGQAVMVPGGATRRLTALEDAQALVAMPVGGQAALPDGNKVTLPWAV